MLSNHNNNHNSYDDYHRSPHFVAWLIVVCHANFSAIPSRMRRTG